MSIDQKELKIRLKTKRNRGIVGALLALEFVLSIVLCVSLAAQIVWPDISGAANTVGTPLLLNYEGYLTDSSNNPLGGTTGTEYCFHFSIYNAASGGAKLWPPAATPSVTAATATDGVFTAVLGASDAFASTTFDFSTASVAYLDVAVNTTTGPTCTSGGSYQELSPRQQILSSGYALTANNVTGQALTTVESPLASTTVQVGLGGGGSAAPVYLGLDIKNTAGLQDYVGDTCTTNGLVWYDSATSHILVCIGGFVSALDHNATSTIAAIDTNAAAASASSGTVVFSNSNGISFGINGQTVTASGLGNVMLSYYENAPALVNTTAIEPVSNTSIVFPFILPNAISASYLRFPLSVSVGASSYATTANSSWTGGVSQTFDAVIYSQGTGANSASLQEVASASIQFLQAYTYTANSNSSQYSITASEVYPSGSGATSSFTTTFATTLSNVSMISNSLTAFTGLRYLDLPFVASLSGGDYWMAFGASTTNATQYTNKVSNNVLAFSNVAMSQLNNAIGPLGVALNASNQVDIGVGSFTAAGVGTTGSIGLANVLSSANNPKLYFQIYNRS